MLVSPPVGTNWRLVFADEFAGTTLDQTKWTTGYWWDGPDGSSNYGNQELEWYVRDEVLVTGGLLRLRARRRPLNGYGYTSGMVSSEDRFGFQYGYAEAMVRVPKGKGLWPAFWLAAEDRRWPPEIDVFEILGDTPSKAYMNYHWKQPDGSNKGGGIVSWTGPDFSAGFHRFGVLWEPGQLVWYVDGVERHRATLNVSAETMYLIANLA
ncbi:MAG TPA: glycoside hydrolase family 16 protein, partial [Azospirillaceae bacterium]|nr:glycoside hydrolase family 16 protein [Azospirillaceae bacterium]